ncbi:MAG: hypothetical protein HYR85_10085 [Planctomycetes bacterium]|nr:hypothetical protein [Planctomycetota bacterium]MBI3846622.1 hypothetical protein [Planctomycetota bacterium]
MAGSPSRAVFLVSEIFERLGIPHLIGGSVASSLMGEVRSTEDVDFVADVRTEGVDGLVAAMRATFYLDDAAIADAVRRGAPFNVIHLETMTKVDVYPVRDSHVREEMRRRRATVHADFPNQTLYLPTPEDLVLRKLDWYRKGSGVSDRQWRDVLGVLKVSGTTIDVEYLRKWADALGVTTHLERALAESGIHR